MLLHLSNSRLVPSMVSEGAVHVLLLSCKAEVGFLPLFQQLDATVPSNWRLLALCAHRLAGNVDAASDKQGA